MADGDDDERFSVELPADVDLNRAYAIASKLVTLMKLEQCVITGRGLSLAHAATIARKGTVAFETRGRTSVPINLPLPIMMGEVESASVFGEHQMCSAYLTLSSRGTGLSLSSTYGSQREVSDQFFEGHIAILTARELLAGNPPRVSWPIYTGSIGLRPDAWAIVIATPRFLNGFPDAGVNVRSRVENSHALLVALAEQEFVPQELSLLARPDDLETLTLVASTLGGECEFTWREGEAFRLPEPNQYTTIGLNALRLKLHWKRPTLELEAHSWRGRGQVDKFFAEQTGCPVTRLKA